VSTEHWYRRRQGKAGSILEQFAELKSDYEIGKASRYKRAKSGIMTLGSHVDYHYRTEAAYFGAMEMAPEMTRNNPLVMQGVRCLVANVVGRGFVLDSDSGDKGIDDVNGYRWAEWSRSPEACDDQQELDFHGLEKLRGSRSRQGHGGACLRRAMFSTRKPTCPNASPLRGLPAWSDVPGRMLRLPDVRGAPLRQPSVTETPPHPDEPGGGGESSEGRCSGCEHGSTVASTVVAKIQRRYTILREMDAGAPTLPFAGGGDHSETTEIRPDGETRTLTDIAPGFEIYGYKGEKLRGFVPTLPGLQSFEHSNVPLGPEIFDEGIACLGQTQAGCGVSRIGFARSAGVHRSQRAVKTIAITISLAWNQLVRGVFRPTHVPNKGMDEVAHAAKPPF
jgi:hypothetical protein